MSAKTDENHGAAAGQVERSVRRDASEANLTRLDDAASMGAGWAKIMLAIGLLVLVFSGEPSIAESLRVAVQKWAASL
jgi:hypothetical protein